MIAFVAAGCFDPTVEPFEEAVVALPDGGLVDLDPIKPPCNPHVPDTSAFPAQQNCGGCGIACKANQLCCDRTDGGVQIVGFPEFPIFARCVPNDNTNCGTCGTACPAGTQCDGGVCNCACPNRCPNG